MWPETVAGLSAPTEAVDLPARVAQFKRAGLDANQVVAVLLHRGEIDPHGAGRTRQLFAAAPAPPGGAP